MKVIVYGINDYIHFWTYEKFKEIHNATLVDYSTEGNLIKYIIYEIDTKEIDINFLNENNITYEIGIE